MGKPLDTAIELANHIAHGRYSEAQPLIEELLRAPDVQSDATMYAELTGMLVDLRGGDSPEPERVSLVRRKRLSDRAAALRESVRPAKRWS